MTTVEDAVRTAAIARYDLLDGSAETELDGLVQLAATACAVPNAVINVISEHHQHQIAAAGFEPSVCAREDSMCAVVFQDRRRVVVPDASIDDRFFDNPFVTGDIGNVRFYASSPLMTPDGIPIGTLCIFDTVVGDLTDDRARALDLLAAQVVDVLELRRLTAELGRSNEQLSRFAGQISHDLANPLMAIAGYLELAADNLEAAKPDSAAAAVARAESATDRMESMIAGLLGFARVGGRLNEEDVELAALISAVREDLDHVVSATSAVIDAPEAAHVRGDRTMLRALFQNLIGNAIGYTAASGTAPHVVIGVTDDDDAIRVTVDDNGPGVAPEDRERVFGLMERGESTSVAGSGIGLATCRRITESHGGRIGLDESPSGGARIWITLPR